MSFKNILAVVAVAGALTAVADTLVMKSGSRLEGTVVRIEGGEVLFKSDDLGELKIKQDKIASIATKDSNTVQYKDNTLGEGVVSMKDGQYALNGKSLDMNNVKAVNPVEETWHGSANLSANSARGNTRSEKVAVIADVNRRWEKDRFTGNAGYYFEQTGTDRDNKKKTDDRIELGLQEDHFWVTKVYSYINGKYERDGINNLMHRYRIGAGMGYQWLDGYVHDATGKWSFNQEVGPTVIMERYEHQKEDDRLTVRYAHHLTWAPKWIDKLAFTHNLEYLPDTDHWADTYLIDSDVGFTYELTAAWQLMGKIEWDYNSDPGPHTKSSDFRYALGLGYKW